VISSIQFFPPVNFKPIQPYPIPWAIILSEFTSAGVPISGSNGFTGGGLTNPFFLAIDPSGNIWAVNTGGPNSVSEFTSSGTAISGPGGYTGGGLNVPVGIAFDGAGNVFVTNSGGNSISRFTSSGTPISNSSGWQGGLNSPSGIAVDGGGNVWVTNSGNNSVTEFVGPGRGAVVTPIVANLLAPYGAHAVNEP
jgi:streptogramin lyase